MAPVKDKRLLKVADDVEESDPKENDFIHIYLNKRLLNKISFYWL